MSKRGSTSLAEQVCFIIDKNLNANALREILPGMCLDSKTRLPRATYKGSHSDDEDYSHILQLAFETRACVLTSDYRMITKAKKFHSFVMGFSGRRCMNGVIVVANDNDEAVDSLKRFRAGRMAVNVDAISRKPFALSIDHVDGSNLSLNLRASPPTAGKLCECRFKN